MASTAPAKSQPLHNFTLPHLKWNKDGHSGGHHQRRRSIKSSSRRPSASSASASASASPVRQSPLRESVSATPPRHHSPLCDSSAPPSLREFPALGDFLGRQCPFPVREWVQRSSIAPDPPLHFRRHDLAPESRAPGKGRVDWAQNQRFHSKDLQSDGAWSRVSLTNPERGTQKSETKSMSKEADEAGIRSKKILIKIPFSKDKIDDEIPPEEPPKVDDKIEADETHEVRQEEKINSNTDEETKVWNLRPRKPIRVSLSDNWDPARNNGPAMPEKNTNKAQSPSTNLSNRSGENADSGQKRAVGEKKVKRKLSVFLSLTKGEIEEDIFSLTGSKPARRPKKRAKNIQRQVDTLFPGAWLISITADSYKVSDSSLKG